MLKTAAGGTRSLVTQAQNLAGIATQPLMTVVGDATSAAARALGWLNQSLAAFDAARGQTNIGKDLQDDLKGWKDLFNSIHVGRPTWELSEDWHADMRATRALWDAGYRSADLEQEMAREHARAAAASGSLTVPVIAPAAKQAIVVPQQPPPGPAEVNVQGQAQVDHTIHVEVTCRAIRRCAPRSISSRTPRNSRFR